RADNRWSAHPAEGSAIVGFQFRRGCLHRCCRSIGNRCRSDYVAVAKVASGSFSVPESVWLLRDQSLARAEVTHLATSFWLNAARNSLIARKSQQSLPNNCSKRGVSAI